MIGSFIYQKPKMWNVYQEETFHLKKRLKGVTGICFVFHEKIHIKGFWFKSITEHGKNCLLVNVIKYMVTVLRKMEIIFWESEIMLQLYLKIWTSERQVRTV